VSRPIEVGDEVIRVDHDRWLHPTGKVIGLVQGGYEVEMHGTNCIVYENDETIELRYPDE
jgi:hypothetical protein